MALALEGNGSRGIAFLVSAGIVFEIIAYSCSSPQTTEINADTRADSLMKWVYIGEAQAVFFIAAAAAFDTKHRAPILAGGALALLISHVLYTHAKRAGLKDPRPGTEY